MTEPNPSETTAGASDLYPVLPLRDIVVFPYMIVPLFVISSEVVEGKARPLRIYSERHEEVGSSA